MYSTIHGYCRFILQYPWIHYALSMHNAILHFGYPCIVNCSMDNGKEHFTYPWKINSIIHVQLDELV